MTTSPDTKTETGRDTLDKLRAGEFVAAHQHVCDQVGCGEMTYFRIVDHVTTLQHGENPEHRREFTIDERFSINGWFDAVHAVRALAEASG